MKYMYGIHVNVFSDMDAYVVPDDRVVAMAVFQQQ